MSKKVSSKKMKRLMVSVCTHGSEYNCDVSWLNKVSMKANGSYQPTATYLGGLDTPELFAQSLQMQRVLNLPRGEYKICRC